MIQDAPCQACKDIVENGYLGALHKECTDAILGPDHQLIGICRTEAGLFMLPKERPAPASGTGEWPPIPWEEGVTIRPVAIPAFLTTPSGAVKEIIAIIDVEAAISGPWP